MKKMSYLGAVLVALLVVPAVRADYVMNLNNYTSLGGSSGVGIIQFNGAGNFQFLNTLTGTSGPNFLVGLVTGTGVTGDATGLSGMMTGTYTIGPITTSGSVQTASVSTSSGLFTINDGAGHNFTANLSFSQIQTDGHIDGLNNLVATVNLTGLSYNGSNNDLKQLASYNGGSLTVTFDFANADTLTTLATGGSTNETGFSGQLSAVPAPASWLLMSLGTGLMGLFGMVRRRRLQVA